jgi:hypothetical protein
MSEPIDTTIDAGNRKFAAVPTSAAALGPNVADVAGTRKDAAKIANYEQALEQDSRWALSEGSRHFEEKSAVFDALGKIVKRLTELRVPYAIVGGMALFHHGVRRFTEDVDILVTKQGLKKIHDELSGRGYLPPHRHSKYLRDTELGVRIGSIRMCETNMPSYGRKPRRNTTWLTNRSAGPTRTTIVSLSPETTTKRERQEALFLRASAMSINARLRRPCSMSVRASLIPSSGYSRVISSPKGKRPCSNQLA